MRSSQGIYQDSKGISFADITLRHQDGRTLASVRVRTAGHTHTGVASFVVAEEGRELVYEDGSWDCREWQWWKDHGRGDEKWPRLVPATSGYEQRRNEICVTSQYTCDNIQTDQEWFFQTQDRDDVLTYNCRQTIQNCGPTDLEEYAQFFACYTETNREKSQFYWSADRQFKSFESVGGKHLDAYIVAPESTFEATRIDSTRAQGRWKSCRYLVSAGVGRSSESERLASHRFHRTCCDSRTRLRNGGYCNGLHCLSGDGVFQV